ncbi:hypothetical protein PACTADRAFT_50871 [Pachysolen tannophilus NRRL Y-2460]|uniref:UDP-N-acetylglucosamine transferase subunit ALG13 n=1 Tax=Pachysolen tannophilus NRRL Y-2460 TaxID=669874 RepID=A0A1E4TTP7_PACTA|nr:hypothetical protein PACTADRAFT_50871 [Pachysolen tannophilus NRRL Y-2460]
MKFVLVTTGATVTFRPLIKLSLSLEFVNHLIDLNFTKLIIQFGNSSNSKDFYLKELETLHNSLSKDFGKNEFHYKEEFSSNDESKITILYNLPIKIGNFIVEGISFDKDLSLNYSSKSSLIISHGGTGSILDSLRLNKKLIVLNNQELADSHQLDIINEFEKKELLIYCKDNYNNKELIKCINKALSNNNGLKQLIPPRGKIIQDIILDCI